MHTVETNRVCEFSFNAAGEDLFAKIVSETGEAMTLPSFTGGDGRLHFRFSSSSPGIFKATFFYSDGSDRYPCNESETIEVIKYKGTNPLYIHGAPMKRKENKKYLEHLDGEPFFYFADTWWMGLTTRLSYPDGIEELSRDRVEKGFTAVQIIAGLYPDMVPFDERGANEAGFPWKEDYSEINPEYFDAADKKLTAIVERGLVPVIVGSWGFFACDEYAGVEVLKRHWKNLIARYGAYPVIWCVAGEANMPFYNAKLDDREAYFAKSRADWNELTCFVKKNDPFNRVVTIHPTSLGHEQLEDESLLDLDMLQTGHGSHRSLVPSMKMVRDAVDRNAMPVINSEACYEGICGASHEEIQRYLFMSCFMSGACGHTYGANGIWQFNSPDKPYGVSPHGATWGDTPWTEAYKLPGSRHIGNAKRFIMNYDWWRFERHPEWVERPCTYEDTDGAFCVGVPREVRMIFIPGFGGNIWGRTKLFALEKDVSYTAKYYNMLQNETTELGKVIPDENGEWLAPKVDKLQDWILLLQAE